MKLLCYNPEAKIPRGHNPTMAVNPVSHRQESMFSFPANAAELRPQIIHTRRSRPLVCTHIPCVAPTSLLIESCHSLVTPGGLVWFPFLL